jgi:kynurenine formamidase
MSGLIENLADARVYDLAQTLRPGIPCSPSHPGFHMALIRRHGDMTRDDGGSASNDLIVMGGHVGTHVDALAHVSQDGRLHGDVDVADAMQGGVYTSHGIDAQEPLVCPGVLLDVAGSKGVDQLGAGTPLAPSDLADAAAWAGVEPRAGDAVLVRTGWATRWGDPVGFLSHDEGVPGPTAEAARWLASQGARVVGSDTTAFEHIRAGMGHSLLPGHRVLLVENGIPIIEMLNLERLAAERVYRFGFVLAPLKIVGGTGSPVRPLALVEG